MADGEEVAIQLTTDGVEFKNILTLNKENMPLWTADEFTQFRVNFSEFAGQKVNVRLYVKRTTKGQVNFRGLKIEGTLYGIVGTIPGMTWDDDVFMVQDADNENIYTATLDVTVDEVPAEAYEYKLRANQNWDGYQLPEKGNQSWMPAEAGDYRLVFTADLAANTLTLDVQRPFSVSFDNKGGWREVYAYTFSYDPATNTVTEFSGAWPGTLVEVSGSFFNRSWTYNFTAEHQPQFIIWNNGTGEGAEQTADLEFINGKKYSYYPEITSVKISGSWNEWNGPEMELLGNYAYLTTVDLTSLTEDQEFKLVVNGEWIGSGELVTIEGDAASSVVENAAGSNMTLKAGKAYDIVAFWSSPSMNVKEGWLLEVTENTTTGINSVRPNATKQAIYNLAGQRLKNAQRGVIIVNGKKVVVK
jgi:hypothetical protein